MKSGLILLFISNIFTHAIGQTDAQGIGQIATPGLYDITDVNMYGQAIGGITRLYATAGTYGSATIVPVITIDTFARIVTITTTAITYPQPVPSTATRGLNSNYTISTTKGAWVTYSVDATVTIALSARTATVTPQYSTNGGSSWVSLPVMAFTPPLISVGLLAAQTLQCSGYVPANALVRIATTTVTGVTYAYNSGQETLTN